MALVAAARVALWTLPFRWVRRLIDSRQMISPQLAAVPVNRLSWAVKVAARRIPGASCLTQAIALQRLLARAGHSAEIRIGVARDSSRAFKSHAWVQCSGEIVLGDTDDLHLYTPMLVLRTGQL